MLSNLKCMKSRKIRYFELLKKTIRPEFLNRIDDIMFLPLGRKEISGIVRLQFELIAQRLNKQGVEIEITEEAINWLAAIGYDPQFGARPIKRAIQNYILNDLSKKILSGNINKGKSN